MGLQLWTLPANTGISLNGEEEYVKTSDKFIVARKLYNSLIENGVISGEVVETINPKDLENTFAINPLNGRTSKIVLGDHVMMIQEQEQFTQHQDMERMTIK